MKLNKTQQEAVCHRDGPALVLAGPGSGKTTVLTARVRHLIEEGVSPSSILVLTFTRSAAREMETRFRRLSPSAGSGVMFSTCHALFFRILRTECGYSAADLLSEAQKQSLLRELMSGIGIEAQEELLREVSSDISRRKNLGGLPPEPPSEGEALQEEPLVSWCGNDVFRTFYREYNERLRQQHRIEYDDMPLLCLSFFDQAPEKLRLWQRTWSHLLVDEFQDINPVQYRLLQLLAAPQDNLFAVGDEDQAIYGFRGSSPELILHFREDYPSARTILLDINYRCPEEIIRPARQLIGANRQRTFKEIRGTGRCGGMVRLVQARGQAQEAELIAADLRARLDAGADASQLAVLYRSRGTARYLLHTLSEQMIPYRMKEKEQDLYTHWITRDLFAYLSLAEDRGNRTDLLRILNRPERRLPREVFARARSGWTDWERQLPAAESETLRRLGRDLDRVARLTPYAALHYILDGIGYRCLLQEQIRRCRIPKEQAEEILEPLLDEASKFDSFAEWRKSIRQEEEYRRQQGTRESGEGVLLSTIHGVKGLEFDVVYLMDVNEGSLPIRTALQEAQIEEERRLCYVAMTRARQDLLLYVVDYQHSHPAQPSRFLEEAALLHVPETGIDEKGGNR